MTDWLILQYKIPPNPSAPRVYVWRKLKQMGALLILDETWVLPNIPRTLENFQWLAAEIIELGGKALLWQGQPVLDGQSNDLESQFTAQVDKGYATLSADLEKQDTDLEQVSRQYQQIKSRDYFHSGLGRQVREKLLARRGDKR